jgi:hypothetical protein
VTVTRGPSGRWSWSYLIDGDAESAGDELCEDAEAALLQGLNAAKAHAEGMYLHAASRSARCPQ